MKESIGFVHGGRRHLMKSENTGECKVEEGDDEWVLRGPAVVLG